MSCRLIISALLMATALPILAMSDSTRATSESREAAHDLRHGRSRKVGMKVVIARPQDGGVPFRGKYAQMRDKAAKVVHDPWLSSKRPYPPPSIPIFNPHRPVFSRSGLKPPPPPSQDGVHL